MAEKLFLRTRPLTGTNVSDNTESAKTWLDSVSPSMCLAKWLHVSLHLTNGRTHSCYHPPAHKIDLNELAKNPSALHNSAQKKLERKLMLGGERPEGCRYCWNIEDAPQTPAGGHRSDRHYRSGETWAFAYRDHVRASAWDDDIDPTYVEVNFNQACNFKCSYCSPHLSSEWQREIERFGPYPTAVPHNSLEGLQAQDLMPLKLSRAQNPYVEAFWRWWPELYQSLHMFRMTGGEPLLDTNTFRVLEYVAKNPKGDLELSITSNFCPVDPALLDRFLKALIDIQNYRCEVFVWAKHQADEPNHERWPRYVIRTEGLHEDSLRRFGLQDLPMAESSEVAHFYDFEAQRKSDPEVKDFVYSMWDTKACKTFSLYVSLDAWGERAEYIRHGMDFMKLWSNVRRLLEETHFTTVNFINTFNLLSVTSFREFLQGILEIRKFVQSFQEVEGKSAPFNNYWNRQRVWFDVPLLRYPLWQSVQNLPSSYHSYVENSLAFMEENSAKVLGELVGFSDVEIAKVKRNLVWMQMGERLAPEELRGRKQDFVRFFREHDRRRGTSLLGTFPEMRGFWEDCEKELS